MTELLDQGAAAIAQAVRTGKVKARDVAEMAISRVEASNGKLTAIVDFAPTEARASADAVDARRKQGFDGPILGVPYTVKDTTWVQGRRVTNGSLLYRDFKPPRDAVAVERLRNAGGIFLGMTNTPEMAAKGHTENKVYGPTRHPLNTALTRVARPAVPRRPWRPASRRLRSAPTAAARAAGPHLIAVSSG